MEGTEVLHLMSVKIPNLVHLLFPQLVRCVLCGVCGLECMKCGCVLGKCPAVCHASGVGVCK